MTLPSTVAAGSVVLERGPLRVELALTPLRIDVRRGGRRLLRGVGVWACEGEVRDRFVQVTEGVIADERLGFPERAVAATVAANVQELRTQFDDPGRSLTLGLRLQGGRRASLSVELVGDEHVIFEFDAEGEPLRLTFEWNARAEERFAGLGAHHALRVDHAEHEVQLGAGRSYTGPHCPADLLALGGIPQGDYAPAPFVQSSRGYAL